MMKKNNLICIIACALVVLLTACIFIFKPYRGVDADLSYICTIQLNDDFDTKEVEEAFKEAGAKQCIVQSQTYYNTYVQDYVMGTTAVVKFSVAQGVSAQEVSDAANETLGNKYFLKFEEELKSITGIINKDYLFKLWPAVLVLVLLTAYAFVRFGVKGGFATLLMPVFTILAVIGICAIFNIAITSFTMPALLLASVIGLAEVIIYLFEFKQAQKRITTQEAYLVCTKKLVIVSAVVAVALAVVLSIVFILGADLLKNFVLTAIIGVAVTYLLTLFVLPAFLKK